MSAKPLLVAGLLVLISACSTTPSKTYIEPAAEDDDGGCVLACKTERNECRRMAKQEYDRCKYIYERRRAQQDQCVHTGGTYCVQVDNCQSRERECGVTYDHCFVACGGRIEGEQKQDSG